MALPDSMRLREVLNALNARPRTVHDFTHASATVKFQFTETAVESWLQSMRIEGWVMRSRRHWQITSAGQKKLAEMDGAVYSGRICCSSSKSVLTGYGAYMARSEGRPGANDYRQFARRGF